MVASTILRPTSGERHLMLGEGEEDEEEEEERGNGGDGKKWALINVSRI